MVHMLTSPRLSCDNKADETSVVSQLCHVYLSLCRKAPQTPAPFSSLDFNEISLSQLAEDRVKVHIPPYVQTHKTLTSSLCGALQELFMPHNRVTDQYLGLSLEH